MEKPSPKYDRISSSSIASKEDAAQKERYYDRMTIRGIQVLRDSDEQDNTPTWRGDHTFSSDAASYSLSHFIEPEVAREHPNWTQEQVSSVATERFEQRLAQDLSYEHQESVHEESIVHWQPIQTEAGSWELATQYGDSMVTLRELWEHTREYAEFAGNPAAYNSEEHRAQIQMQEELISGGANGFVSVLSHPDAVRYVQVWQKTEDGSIVSKQVDLFKTTGRDFTHDEGAKLIDNLANYFKEDVGGGEASVISYAHIYIHEKDVAEDDIRMIAIAQTMEIHEATAISSERYVPKVLFQAGEKAARDTTESMVQLGAFLREHIDKKIAAFTRTDTDARKLEAKTSVFLVHEQPLNRSLKESIHMGQKVVDLQKTSPETSQAVDAMKSLEADWWIIRSMMQHKDSFSAAPSAILMWMTDSKTLHTPELHADILSASFEKDHSTEPTRMQKIGSSIRHAIAFMLGETEKKHASEIHTPLIRSSSEHMMVTEHLRQSEGISVLREGEVRILPLSLSTVDSLLSVLRKIAMHDALKHVYRRSAMRDAKSHEAVIGAVSTAPLREMNQDETQHDREVLHNTRQVTVAIIIWWLTEYSRQTFKKPDIAPKTGIESMMNDVKDDESVSSPWLLLSIVWYLTAIREHGKQGAMQKKQTGKKKSKQNNAKVYASLPPTGIIFTFGS